MRACMRAQLRSIWNAAYLRPAAEQAQLAARRRQRLGVIGGRLHKPLARRRGAERQRALCAGALRVRRRAPARPANGFGACLTPAGSRAISYRMRSARAGSAQPEVGQNLPGPAAGSCACTNKAATRCPASARDRGCQNRPQLSVEYAARAQYPPHAPGAQVWESRELFALSRALADFCAQQAGQEVVKWALTHFFFTGLVAACAGPRRRFRFAPPG